MLFLLLLVCLVFGYEDYEYQIGVGIADALGKHTLADTGFMGYGLFAESTKGVDLPLYARAVIMVHKNTQTRVAHVTLDYCFVSIGVKMYVIKKLDELGLSDLYNDESVMIVSTHTHSDPGGYEFGFWYDMTIFGFTKSTFDAMVNGIVNSIVMAHNNLSESGRILHDSDMLLNCSINRSLFAYIQNPAEERKKYEADGGETDKRMTVIRFENEKKEPLGAIVYYAVHGTSMNHSGHIVSGDNKGYASFMFEKSMWKGEGNFILGSGGPGYFVASFPQQNHGDSTPNILGALCSNDGLPCDFKTSTCKEGPFNLTNDCIGRGPGLPDYDMYDSTKIIGTRQFEKAYSLYKTASTQVSGKIQIRHKYVEMNSVDVSADYSATGLNATTCIASAGDAMLAGTTDGEGFILDHQNMTEPNVIIDWLIHWLSGTKPSEELKKCQHPKPIAAVQGEKTKPIWSSKHNQLVQTQLPIHLVTIGTGLVITGIPGEMTTMSGRRMREKITETFKNSGFLAADGVVIPQSLTNGYSEYIATYQEYQAQRYEGGSSLFGPFTLDAYIQEMDRMAEALIAGEPVEKGPTPEDLMKDMLSLSPDPLMDIGKMGKVLQDVGKTYKKGDIVTFKFVGSNPRNYANASPHLMEIYKYVDGNWVLFVTESDWSTRWSWKTHDLIERAIMIEWNLDFDGLETGMYKIKAYGSKKELDGKLVHYEVESANFQVDV